MGNAHTSEMNGVSDSGGFGKIWDLIQFGTPFVFGLIVLAVGFWGVFWLDAINFGDWMGALGLTTKPTTPEGGAKLMSWLLSIPLFFGIISVFSAATHPSGQYWKSSVDMALSIWTAICLGGIVMLYMFEVITLDVYQRKFLWFTLIAVLLDTAACSIITRRIGMQWGLGNK